ncbi:MAG TPA: hypothetical protein VMX54_04515 [Vicinamibacteria bacterium]|nr:hypothetical protein [Vicinamibacteria bacterium]
MDDSQLSTRWRKVGGIWRPKPGSKSKGSGSVTVNGLEQRFTVVANQRKRAGTNAPDYLLVTTETPTVDHYAAAPGQQQHEDASS